VPSDVRFFFYLIIDSSARPPRSRCCFPLRQTRRPAKYRLLTPEVPAAVLVPLMFGAGRPTRRHVVLPNSVPPAPQDCFVSRSKRASVPPVKRLASFFCRRLHTYICLEITLIGIDLELRLLAPPDKDMARIGLYRTLVSTKRRLISLLLVSFNFFEKSVTACLHRVTMAGLSIELPLPPPFCVGLRVRSPLY